MLNKLERKVEIQVLMRVSQCERTNVKSTYSGLGGSLASNVPSFLVLSFVSSGSLSVSESSIGSNGLTG